MKLRCWVANMAVMGCVAATVVAASGSLARDTVSPGLAEMAPWTPDLVARPVRVDARGLRQSERPQGPASLVAAQRLAAAVTSNAPRRRGDGATEVFASYPGN